MDHLPTALYAMSMPIIPSAHRLVALAIISFIASFLPEMRADSYDHDLPPKISVIDAKISLTMLAPTMTSAEMNHRY